MWAAGGAFALRAPWGRLWQGPGRAGRGGLQRREAFLLSMWAAEALPPLSRMEGMAWWMERGYGLGGRVRGGGEQDEECLRKAWGASTFCQRVPGSALSRVRLHPALLAAPRVSVGK